MVNVIERIRAEKIIAIVRLDDLSAALELSQTLVKNGINIIEFTFTNPEAPKAIAGVRDALGDEAIIGAGSVISVQQVEQAALHGAAFIVSPVTKFDVIEACHKKGLPAIPGAYTPTEIQAAWEMDVMAVKVFPARGLGSHYISDILAPLPHLRLIPTGGISAKNIAAFIDAGAFAVGIGGALCNAKVVEARDWQSLARSAQALRKALL